TTENSGCASGDAWDVVTPGAGSIVYDDDLVLPGTPMSITISKGASQTCVVGWETGSTNQVALGVWVYLDALPSSGISIIRFRNSTNTSGRADININSNGTVFCVDATGTTLGNSTGTIATDQWIYITVQLTNGNTS